jgi:hypothetical protein
MIFDYNIYNIIIVILLINNFMCLLIGYILSLYTKQEGVYISTVDNKRKKEFISEKKDNIKIDDKKIVTEIKTDGLEKKYQNLGETKISDENISSSINKLKNMKG